MRSLFAFIKLNISQDNKKFDKEISSHLLNYIYTDNELQTQLN
jgi:hypothetical protein